MTRPLRVLDLFSGLEGWSSVFRARGHEVVTLDFDPKFGADITMDILHVVLLDDLERNGPFDIILASPPCESFSTGSIGRHWGGGKGAYAPKTTQAVKALMIMDQTFTLIDSYVNRHPGTLYVIENPRGVMRKVAPRTPNATTWYCQWGEKRAKPTDLWTNVTLFPDGEWPQCYNGAPDHDAQSRYYWKRKALGQTGGTQGLANPALRALIPDRLATAVARFAENRHTIQSHATHSVARTCACSNQLQPHDRMRVCP